MSYLPDIFLDGLKKRLVSTLTSPPLSQWNLPQNPFDVFNFNDVHSVSGSTASSRYRRTILTFIEIIIQLHTAHVYYLNLNDHLHGPLRFMSPKNNFFQLSKWRSTLLYLYIVYSIFRLSRLLAVAHAFWHHAGFNQIQQLPELVRDKFLPIVRTEEQLLFIYHLAGPFLQRLHTERYTRWVFLYSRAKAKRII